MPGPTPLVQAYIRVTVTDSSGTRSWEQPPVEFGLGVGTVEEVLDITLTGSADTTVSVPAGARAVLIRPGTATSLSIKGSTGDSNLLTITPASNPISADLFLTLGASPVLVIHNGLATSQPCVLVFF